MKNIILTFTFIVINMVAFSQGGVSINNTGVNPDGSAMLDIESTDKGLLIPRLQLTDINDAVTVTAAANSLLVFNLAPSGVAPNDVVEGFYYWNASITQWIRLVSGSVVGTDDQQIDSLVLVGNTLTAYVEDGGSASVDLSALSDADSDPTNEHNTGANLTGTDLNIVDGGGTQTVDLSGLLDSAYSRDEWKDSDTLGGGFGTNFVYANQSKGFGNDVVVTDSGRVGIGTTNPIFKVDIQGVPNSYGFRSSAPSGGTFFGNHFKFADDITAAPLLTLSSDNSIGSSRRSQLTIEQAAQNGLLSFGIGVETDVEEAYLATDYRSDGVTPMALKFKVANQEKMRIASDGNVGIGTTNPNSKLTVFGNNSTSVDPTLKISGNGSSASSYLLQLDRGGTTVPWNFAIGTFTGTFTDPSSLNIFPIGNPGGFAVFTQDNGLNGPNNTPQLYVDVNGNVGIGTTTPTQLLTVDNGTSVGTYTTAGWVHTSDARLKTNVAPLTSSLDKVMQIQGVNFDWINAPEENRQIGFLAQDLQKILPEAVVVDSLGNYGVAYGNLTPLLVEAVKELKLENQQLKATLLLEKENNIELQTESASNDAEILLLVKQQQAQIDELKLILLQTSDGK